VRVALVYPPYQKQGKFAFLPQNRQFIYSASEKVKIFPVVMATAATRLRRDGHRVFWLDGITERLTGKQFRRQLKNFRPEMVVLEAKAPIMKKLWQLVNKLKTHDQSLTTVLVGDHVTYFPEESFTNSAVDYVLTGGDYDFLLANLLGHLEKGEKLEGGIWYRDKLKLVTTGRFRLSHDLNKTPIIDRHLTHWQDYGEAYLFDPCAYMMFGRGCGIREKESGACTFCIWQDALWQQTARLRTPAHVVREVKNLVQLRTKEIFDDTESGVLANYRWLEEFYSLLKREKLLGKVVFSSNARGDQLDKRTCRLLNKIGFRLLKVGLESGSNKTLARIGKKETVERIIRGVKNAKDAGLRVMLTVMVGYPWETEAEVQKTYRVARELMLYRTQAGDCLQASVIVPYPGTPFWRQAKKQGWLTVGEADYEKLDMSRPVLKTEIVSRQWCHRIWSIQKDPRFIVRSGLTVRKIDELKLLFNGAGSLVGHLLDYSRKK
jgi:anaerobic magnesium-protoporphyrin IX monomethyl ester cyclase